MNSDASYEKEVSHRRRHRYDDEYDDSSNHGCIKKCSHRYPDSSDMHSRWDKLRDRDDGRDRRRRRSRSPDSRRRRSHDRDAEPERRTRDSQSRSSVGKSYRDRRSRREEDDSDEEAGDSGRKHRRRPPQSPDGRDEHKDRYRRRKRTRGAMGDQEPAGNQVATRRSEPLPSQSDSFAMSNGKEPEKPKEKPNLGTTGHLAAASNSVAQADGSIITLKYHEPPESRKPPPRDKWKLFVFKGEDIVDTIDLSARSCWLVGRESAVVDLPAENPSISKQHAVIQFRYTDKRNEFGDKVGRVKPYLIDLQSANGTQLNGEQVPDRRYLELRPKDVVKFGTSDREYVAMLSRD